MNNLYTFNEHVVMNKKSDKENDKNSLLKGLCSMIEFEINYTSGRFFKKPKTVGLKVWYTPSKITLMEPDPTKEGTFLSPKFPVDIPFSVGDNIEKAIDWSRDNGHEIIRIKRKGRYK